MSYETPLGSSRTEREFDRLREPGQLEAKERHVLRNTLAALGVAGVSAGAYESVQQMPETDGGKDVTSHTEAMLQKRHELREAITALHPEVLLVEEGRYYTTRPQMRPWTAEEAQVKEIVTEQERVVVPNEQVEGDDMSATHLPHLDPAVRPQARPQPFPEVPVVDTVVADDTTEVVRPQARPDSYVGEIEPQMIMEPFPHTVFETLPEHSREFLTRVIAAETYITMSDGVLVKNEAGHTLGIVPVQMVDGVNPGQGFSETGHATAGYARAWQEAVRTTAAERFGSAADELVLSYNWKEVASAAAKIGYYPESIMDATMHFAEQSVSATDPQSRLEYLTNNLTITNQSIPEQLNEQLRRVAIGIPGEESRFDETVVSPVGAATTFQIMPETWEALGYPAYGSWGTTSEGKPVPPPYEMQVEAFGRHLGNIYDEIHNVEKTRVTLEQIRAVFASDEAYYEYFLVPLMVNAYNVGSGTARSLVAEFVASEAWVAIQTDDKSEAGYDIFQAASLHAYHTDEGALSRYKEWSWKYPVSVFAFAQQTHVYSSQDEKAPITIASY